MRARIQAVLAAAAVAGGCLAGPEPRPLPDDWLRVADGRIRHGDGSQFRGRGVNIPDTRGCNACSFNEPVPAEVERRIDYLVGDWGASFVRLLLESYADANGRINYRSLVDDPGYLADIERIVAHIGSKPGVVVAIVLWIDPSFTDANWPSTETHAVWRRLVDSFADDAHVIFDIGFSPESDPDGSQDAALWAALDDTVAAVRDAEVAAGAPPHVVLVPGTAGGTELDYYLEHPITAGGGEQIAYGVHVSGPPADLGAAFVDAAASLPVVVSRFAPPAPFTGTALDESDAIMAAAEEAEVPWLAWNFHMRCEPSMLVDNSDASCGVDMTLAPTEWGQRVVDRLAQPW